MNKVINIKDLNASKVFCTAPWTHLHSFPNGEVVACCLSPATEVLGNLNEQRLEEIWNSDKIKELRTNMLEGKESQEICHRCYNKEEEGFQSLRIGMNQKYLSKEEDLAIIESTQEDGTVEHMNLLHWDFRFSNLCNLSCRSCGPGLSSSWMKDHKKIFTMIPANTPALEKLPEERNSLLLEDALKNIDIVRSIHFAGGEPMMMEEHWIILDALKAAGRKDVQIHYSTNMTRFKFGKKHAFDYWHDLDHIYVSASIDEIGDRFNYIRNGGDWPEVFQNLKNIQDQKFKNLELAFHPTLSVFNILSFPEMVKFIWENDSFQGKLRNEQILHYFVHIINLNPLTYPDFYSMTILPPELKEKAAQGIRDLIEWVNENIYIDHSHDGVLHRRLCDTQPLLSLIDFLYGKDDTHLLPTFIKYTENLDGIRSQSLWTTFPELAGLDAYRE